MSAAAGSHTAFVEGLSLWAPTLPGWVHAEPVLGGHDGAADRKTPSGEAPVSNIAINATARPVPRSLAANERRRAPDSVLAALQVAEEAVAMSGCSAAALASVFTSAHGDLPILDAMLRTLATEPQLLSPMRFHHSVHNAPSGYWAIAAGSHAASTALAAFEGSAGAGLLEGLVQVAAEHEAVLVVGCDTGAVGPLVSVNASRGLLAWALVLAPERGPHSRFELQWRLAEHTAPAGVALAAAAANAASAALAPLFANAQAASLPLFKALASHRSDARLAMACGAGRALELRLQPLGCAGQGAGAAPGA